MALHQYIGARYVPYYYENSLDPTSTEWEPNVNYEALTVVTLPNQHSYISKKSVPDTIGSPALNAEYWLDTGSDNAYIQQLQDQIDIINNTDLPGIRNDINTLDGKIDDVEDMASSVGEFARQFKNNKIVIIGDSLSIPSTTWADEFKTMAEGQGCTVDNVSGGGYKSANALVATNALTDPYDVAIIWIGINDAYDDIPVGNAGTPGTYVYNMCQIIDKLYNLNSTIKIFAFSLPWYDYTYKQSLKSGIWYTAAMVPIYKSYGVAFKNISDMCASGQVHHTSRVPGDPTNVHFTEAMSRTIVYSTILNKILTQSSDCYDEVVAMYETYYTAGTNVSISALHGAYQVGKLISYNAQIVTSAPIAASQVLMTPKFSPLNPKYPTFVFAIGSDNKGYRVAVAVNGNVQTLEAIPAGTYTLITSYEPAISLMPTLIAP